MNMDIGQNPIEYRQEVTPAGPARPDWLGLRTKLGAAHAARRVLLEGARALCARGSFDRACAHALTSLGHDLPSVNPGSSEVGNLLGGNWEAAAGHQIASGRG
jgi:hypothetical protein